MKGKPKQTHGGAFYLGVEASSFNDYGKRDEKINDSNGFASQPFSPYRYGLILRCFALHCLERDVRGRLSSENPFHGGRFTAHFVDLHEEKNKNKASITTASYLIILKTIILDRIN